MWYIYLYWEFFYILKGQSNEISDSGGEVDGVELQEEEEDALRGRRCASESVKRERVEAFFEYILCSRYRPESFTVRQ